jgi:hypothetical protein
MSVEKANLASPFSTGGGGYNFENNVQTAFVVLMVSGGFVPCLPALPIKKIKLQGRYDGYETDDCIVFLEQRGGGEKAKLLAQIKHSVSITENDEVFADVIRAAWRDFTNPRIFDRRCDVIALITGPLSATDVENVRTILDWARHSESPDDFLTKVNLAKFSSDAKRAKLQAFRTQLKKANGGADLTNDQLWRFLRVFHLLGYDLDVTSGVTLSLLKSHIGQFASENIAQILGAVAKEVASVNQNAGAITIDTLSEEVRAVFRERPRPQTIPPEFITAEQKAVSKAEIGGMSTDYKNAAAFASLLGGWNEKVPGDVEAIKELINDHD